MRIPILREQTLPTVAHPETLRGLVSAGEVRLRVDHPINEWLQHGFSSWPGDPRLCLYANTFTWADRPQGSWELWRLEVDGRYRLHSDYDGRLHLLGPDFFWQLVDRFHIGDTRTGHDPLARQQRLADAEQARRARDFRDYTEDIVDHYLWPAWNRSGRTILRDGKDSPAV